MEKIKLTKREYLGRVNLAQFKNTETGETKIIEISDEQYQKMGEVGGSQFNPESHDNWVYESTTGGSIKIDTPDGLFGVNDYTIITNENDVEYGLYFVCEKDSRGIRIMGYTEEEINQKYNL